ncbi:MAG TPA: hypothetical protein VG106_00825, partial [Vicinamibacterales bacterium]|nr:hypothetical protein [Vicinamibacterales bacterium]
GTAYLAAHDTVHALNRNDVRAYAFSAYERYARDTFEELLAENEMFYRGFAHPEIFERIWAFKFVQAFSGARGPAERYSSTDPYLLNFLEPRWRQLVQTVVTVQREHEANGESGAATATRLRAIIDPVIASLARRPAVQQGRFHRAFAHYDDNYERIGEKVPREVALPTWRCPTCEALVPDIHERCYVCSTRKPEVPEPGHSPRGHVTA